MTFQRESTTLSTAELAGTSPSRETQTTDPRTKPSTAEDTMHDGAAEHAAQNHERVVDSAPMAPPTQESTSPRSSTLPDSAAQSAKGDAAPLFPAAEGQQYRTRWTEIQAGFVDEPRKAVESADGLVAEVMKRLAQSFADERSTLEGQWDKGGEIDTEQLRLALRRYRSFFDRLLAI